MVPVALMLAGVVAGVTVGIEATVLAVLAPGPTEATARDEGPVGRTGVGKIEDDGLFALLACVAPC